MTTSYSCTFFYYTPADKWTEHNNHACWAGIQSNFGMAGTKLVNNFKDGFIYIPSTLYRHKDVEEYIDLLFSTINEITTCEEVEINKKTYLKFKLLGTYDQSLFLLNFIRNLWCQQAGYNQYCFVFFKALKKIKKGDPVERLTMANILSCKEAYKNNNKKGAMEWDWNNSGNYGPGHSNIFRACEKRTLEELLAFKGTALGAFLKPKTKKDDSKRSRTNREVVV